MECSIPVFMFHQMIGSNLQIGQGASDRRRSRSRLFRAGNDQFLPDALSGVLDKTGDWLLVERIANIHDNHGLIGLRRPRIADQRAASVCLERSLGRTFRLPQ